MMRNLPLKRPARHGKSSNGAACAIKCGKPARERLWGHDGKRPHRRRRQLKQLAQQKNIVLPSTLADKEQKMVSDLQKKTGKDFDKAYMNLMRDDHKKDIKEFTKAGNACKDSDLKGFANNTLPVLQKHLDSVRAITGKQ
jgi:predicted outer membrane protein